MMHDDVSRAVTMVVVVVCIAMLMFPDDQDGDCEDSEDEVDQHYCQMYHR